MSYSVIIVDLVKDNLLEVSKYMLDEVRRILPQVQRLIEGARSKKIPVIFACDSFLPGDFIFGGRMKPHAIRGTQGAEVIDEIEMTSDDYFLPKRRFSAFFKTDLDITLRSLKVDTVVIAGIATTGCVLTTAWDALSYDFKAIIDIYRKNALYPLFRILSLEHILREF